MAVGLFTRSKREEKEVFFSFLCFLQKTCKIKNFFIFLTISLFLSLSLSSLFLSKTILTPVRRRDRLLRVRDHGDRDLAQAPGGPRHARPRAVDFLGVRRRHQHLRARLLKLLGAVGERDDLGRADVGEVLRVEGEDDVLAGVEVVVQGNIGDVSVGEGCLREVGEGGRGRIEGVDDDGQRG